MVTITFVTPTGPRDVVVCTDHDTPTVDCCAADEWYEDDEWYDWCADACGIDMDDDVWTTCTMHIDGAWYVWRVPRAYIGDASVHDAWRMMHGGT